MNLLANWKNLAPIQQNAIIAEKIFGWQWIPFDFDDVGSIPEGQLWLLPDALATHNITNGEWTWYIEEEEVWPKGSISPLPHKDNHILPIWIPDYLTSMSAAMAVLRAVVELEACDKEILCNTLLWAKTWLNCEPQEILERVCEWTPEKICLAALESIGCEVQL